MDERFIPKAKRPKTVDQFIRGLEPDIFQALNNYRPNPNRQQPPSAASSVSSMSDCSWENIGGRVEGTNNILLNWGGKSKANDPARRGEVQAELDEFPVEDKDNPLSKVPDTLNLEDNDPSSAQNVIRRNIDQFLQMQMNRYVLNNRKFLDLSDRDVEQVQKNIINYWLDKHQRIERDPLYNFCELVAGALDEKVEYLLADARDFRQVFEGKTATGKEFRSVERVTEASKKGVTYSKKEGGKLGGGSTSKTTIGGKTPDQGEKQDSFISEQQDLLKKDRLVRDALKKYAKEKIEGRNASVDADTFMLMLKDFEISGHVEVKPPLTNSWKAVHRIVIRKAYGNGITSPSFFSLIADEDIRASYARATALQMMVYRQLDKRRSYLAVDYDRIKEELEEALRDLIDMLREKGVLHAHSADTRSMIKSIAAASGRTIEMITDVSGEMREEVEHSMRNTFAQIKIKRGISKKLTLGALIATPNLSSIFGRYVGAQMRLQLDPKHQGRLTIEMQQRESEVNTMLTELMAALKQNGYVKLPVDRYRMVCADFT